MKKNQIRQPLKSGAAKVPVVIQMEELECGAASVAMILGYYKRFVPLSQLRKEAGVSRDGTTLRSLQSVAAKYGLQAEGYRYSLESLKTKATYPCIIFWQYCHFVVLTGYKNGKFYVNDPGQGSVRYTEKQMEEGYSNVCMILTPTENFEPGGKPDSVTAFAMKRIRGAGGAWRRVPLLGGRHLDQRDDCGDCGKGLEAGTERVCESEATWIAGNAAGVWIGVGGVCAFGCGAAGVRALP